MATFKWTIEIEVDETWVEDGFDLDNPGCLQSHLDNFLPYASGYEKSFKVISSPNPVDIAQAQGYKTVAAMRADYQK